VIISRFRFGNRGSVGILGALAVGMLGTASCFVIEHNLATEARRDIQRALDEAVLSAARAITPGGNEETDVQRDNKGDRGDPGNPKTVVSDTGENVYRALLENDRISLKDTSFKLVGTDVVSAVAKAEYKTVFANIVGIEKIEIVAEAQAVAGTPGDSAPACFATWLNGVSVEGGSNLDAAQCGISSAADITVNGLATTSLDCPGGECPVEDNIGTGLGDWAATTGMMTACLGEPGAGWTEQIIYGTARFCSHVIVDSGQTLHLMGGDFYFEQGLTVRNGGRVDSTGNGGSTIILGQNAILTVEAGATFTIMPYGAGSFPGISLALAGTGQVSQFDIDVAWPGYVHMDGLVYAPAADITIGGPDAVVVGAGGLAIWSEGLSLRNGATLPGAPTTVGEALPLISKGKTAAPPRLLQ